MSGGKTRSAKISTPDGNVVVEIYSVGRDGEKLVMDAKVLDAMKMDMVVTSGEVLNVARMILPVAILYMLLLPFWSLKRFIIKLDKSSRR